MSRNEYPRVIDDISHIKDMKTIIRNTKELLEKAKEKNTKGAGK